MQKSISTLINARWVLPVVPRNTVLENHSIAIDEGKILAILPTKEAQATYLAKTVIDRSNHVIMPGLINTHAHTPMNLFRGLADDLPLMDWLNNHIWPAEQKIINSDSVYAGSRLAIAEMIRTGTTCFNDHYFFPTDTARAVLDMGLRASLGHVVMNVPTDWAQDEVGYLSKAKNALSEQIDSDRLTWTIAPHAPYTNSDSSLSKAKALADEYNLRMHVHLHETQHEIDIDLANHNKRPMQRFHDLGLLDEKMIAVHMVHLNEEEIALVKATGTHVSHNPQSNMKLASGFAPINDLMQAGVNVCLGTDGAASNNDLDMFSEAQSASFMAKAASKDPTALDAMTTLELATINGAKALGIADKVGSLEVGKMADMIAIDLSHSNTQPIYSPISHLAYAVNSHQVSDTWVAGTQLLSNSEFTQFDIHEVIAKAQPYVAIAKTFASKASQGNPSLSPA